jgi:hypothetical protein
MSQAVRCTQHSCEALYLTLVTWIPCLSAALQTAEPNRNTIMRASSVVQDIIRTYEAISADNEYSTYTCNHAATAEAS